MSTIVIAEERSVPEADTPYARIGGAEGVRRLVDHFYDLMELEPRFADLRAIHPTHLQQSRDKLFLFLSGWMGGPSLYVERYGHPRLRMRHFPYAIGSKERDDWMACMTEALNAEVDDAELRAMLQQSFSGTADWMRNKAEAGQAPDGNVVHA